MTYFLMQIRKLLAVFCHNFVYFFLFFGLFFMPYLGWILSHFSPFLCVSALALYLLFSGVLFPPFSFCASLAYFLVLYHLCALSFLFFVFSFCLSLLCVLFGVSLFFVFSFSLFFLFLCLSLFMIPFYLCCVLSRFVLIFVFVENMLKWRQTTPFKQKFLTNYNMDTLPKPKPPTKLVNQITGICRPARFFLVIYAPCRAPWLSTQHLNHVLFHSPLASCQSINPS